MVRLFWVSFRHVGAWVKIECMKLRYILLLPLLVASVGCMTEKRSYQVTVENKLSRPVTVWLVKEYGPMEDGWLSPEQIATLANPPADDHLPAVVLPPGRHADRGPINGSFDPVHGRAYLRVYSGTPTLTEMLAIGKGSLSRMDLLLQPGANAFEIDDDDGLMKATKVTP